MSEAAFEALLEEMKQGGLDAIDPIDITAKRNVYGKAFPRDISTTLDGNHRLRAAKKLGWKQIRANEKVVSGEQEARLISYAKNYERGTLDPYAQAAYFKWFVDSGMTHAKIAKLHRIDRTTVTKHLSLCKIAPKAKKKLVSVPRVTVSHLEPVATLKPKQQEELSKEFARDHKEEPPSVRTIEHRVKMIKRAEKEAEELRKAVEKAKYPKCPKCGKPPKRRSWRGLPWVQCSSGLYDHDWNLETGLEKREHPKGAKKKAGPTIPKYIRSTHGIDDFRQAFQEYARNLIPKFTEINNLSCDGSVGKDDMSYVHAEIGGYWTKLRVELNGQDFSITVEPKTYTSKRLQDFKTSITIWPEPKSKEDLAKLEKLVSEIFTSSGMKF